MLYPSVNEECNCFGFTDIMVKKSTMFTKELPLTVAATGNNIDESSESESESCRAGNPKH